MLNHSALLKRIHLWSLLGNCFDSWRKSPNKFCYITYTQKKMHFSASCGHPEWLDDDLCLLAWLLETSVFMIWLKSMFWNKYFFWYRSRLEWTHCTTHLLLTVSTWWVLCSSGWKETEEFKVPDEHLIFSIL